MFFVDLQFSKGTFNIGDLSNMQNALVMCFSLLYDFLADELYMAECCGISSHMIFSYCERKKSFNVSHWGMYGLN